jgi:AAA domain, putative AbiEii toxin, Type IV TA system
MRFPDLSSGEQQILGTFTRVLAEIKDNCIIFIDEPEVSLHPSWQIRYIPTLLDALKDFPSTQVVITTHSHFLVSDVEAQRTTLVVANGDESGNFQLFEGDVFGRSPENILYRVFGVGTSGNFYVERDLTLALQMISGQTPPETGELSKLLLRLERIGVKDNEAFATIVAEIRNFLTASTR